MMRIRLNAEAVVVWSISDVSANKAEYGGRQVFHCEKHPWRDRSHAVLGRQEVLPIDSCFEFSLFPGCSFLNPVCCVVFSAVDFFKISV